jgi:hypothetical protein
MIRTLRNLLATAALALGFALPASAVTGGTDFTDLWWNPAESGWGLNVIHQNGIIFATLYVYDAAGTPHFFSGSETRGTGTVFTGPLYETRGTPFTVTPYNVAAYGATQVGTITLSFSTANSGTLSYSVGATNVTKSITRFAFATDNLSGNYLGGLTASSSCTTGAQNTLIFDTLRVTHSGNAISMTVNFYNSAGLASVCSFSGTYAPMGRLGNITGSYTCTVGGSAANAGTFSHRQRRSGADRLVRPLHRLRPVLQQPHRLLRRRARRDLTRGQSTNHGALRRPVSFC